MWERNAQIIAQAQASGSKTVQTEAYDGQHDLCDRCDGTGLLSGLLHTDALICTKCGGRGVTRYAKEKIAGLQ